MRQRSGGDAAAIAECDLVEDGIGAGDQVAADHPGPQHVVMGAAGRLHREADVLFHGEIRKQVGELEGAAEARAGAQRRGMLRDVGAVEQDAAV